jgi:hypothetical protein
MPAGVGGNLNMKEPTNFTFRRDGLFVSLLQINCLWAVFVLSVVLGNTSPLSNLYVPDGISYLDEATENAASGNLWQIVGEAPVSVLLTLFNAIFFSVSPLLFPIINSLLLVFAIRVFSRWSAPSSLLLFLMLPYFWLATTLPSKDILIFALFSVLAFRLMEGVKPIGFIELLFWSAVTFFVRSGFGVVVFGASALILFGRKFGISPRILVGVALISMVGLDSFRQELFPDTFLVTTGQATAAMSEFSETLGSGIGGLFLRLLGNITNAAFRPVFLDINGGISALGVAYFISGLSLLVAFTCFLTKLFGSGSIRDQYIAAFGLANIIGLSLSPFVSGRYSLPVVGLVFLMSDVSIKWIAKCFCVVSFLSVLAGIAYRQLPDYPQPYDLAAFSLSRVIDWP